MRPCLYSKVRFPDLKASPPLTSLGTILSLDDFERAARRHLPRPIFEYVVGSVEDNASARDNRAAFAELGFVPRVLVDMSKRSTETSLFGHAYSAPFGIAPMAAGSRSPRSDFPPVCRV